MEWVLRVLFLAVYGGKDMQSDRQTDGNITGVLFIIFLNFYVKKTIAAGKKKNKNKNFPL